MIDSSEPKPNSDEVAGGAYIKGNINTGGGDFVGRDKIVNIIQYITNPPSIQVIYKDLGHFLNRHFRLLFTIVMLEAALSVLFFQYKDRYLISWLDFSALWLVYSSMALLLAIVIWGWRNVALAHSLHTPIDRSLLFASAFTIILSGSIFFVVRRSLTPPEISDDKLFGIAIATFGEGANFHATDRSIRLSKQLLNDFERIISSTLYKMSQGKRKF